ncbi:hypothetical protein MKX01_040235 [Papaver californicum]|nr:hypothetical protein MKX01_040235 [Papaver californicum]
MKKLNLYSEITSQIELQSKDEVLTLFACDIKINRFFFASSANIVYISQIPSAQECQKTSVAEIEHIDLEPGDSITTPEGLSRSTIRIQNTLNLKGNSRVS